MNLDPEKPPAWLLLVDYWPGMTQDQVIRMSEEKAAQWRWFVERHGDDSRIEALAERD